MTVVERDVDPALPITYDISFEDTEHTPDEVATGRRHQLLGFCRQHSPQSPLPTWLSQADVDDAASIPLIDPSDVGPDDILDLDAAWTDCAIRIVADDARLPITDAAAAQGVVWDTTGLARGAWVIEGYTWDPPFNLWSPRPGVVAVFDDASATDNPPVAAVSTGELTIYEADIATIEGCVIAGDGATMTASWAETVAGDDQIWTPFVEGEPVEGTSFTVGFAPPDAIVAAQANIRVEIEDAQGQSYTAYMLGAVVVLPGSGGACAESGGGFLEDPGCDASSGSGSSDAGSDTTMAASADGSSSDTPDATGPGGESCACASGDASACAIAGPLIVVLWRRRRPAWQRRSWVS